MGEITNLKLTYQKCCFMYWAPKARTAAGALVKHTAGLEENKQQRHV